MNFSRTRVGDAGLEAFAGALQSNRTLTALTLVFSHTHVGDAGLEAFAGALQSNCTITALTMKFHGTSVGESGLEAFAGVLQSNYTLTSLAVGFSGPHVDDAEVRVAEMRNRAIAFCRRAFAAVCKMGSEFRFGSFADKGFRRSVFAFMLPAICRQWPIELARGFGVPRPRCVPLLDASPPVALAAGVARTFAADVGDGAHEKTDVADSLGEASLQQALLESRAEVAPLSIDGIVLLRLTRKACTPPVSDVLMRSPLLACLRRRAEEASCSVAPFGDTGPKFFVPWTSHQLEELSDAGFELKGHHILAHSSDKALIEAALSESLPCGKRPKIVSAEHTRHLDAQEAEGGAEASYLDLRDFSEPLVEVEYAYEATASSAFCLGVHPGFRSDQDATLL